MIYSFFPVEKAQSTSSHVLYIKKNFAFWWKTTKIGDFFFPLTHKCMFLKS